MFVLGKILNFALLPPGVFIIGLVALAILAARGDGRETHPRRRLLAWMAFALAALFYLSSIGLVEWLMIGPLERAYPPIPAGWRPDVVVVLGGGAGGGSPERPRGESLSEVSLARLVYGYELASRTGAHIIVSSGNPFAATKDSEAGLMRGELLALGAKDASITVEGGSRSTLENARFSLGICRRLGFTRPAIVTSALHMPRAMRCFRRFGSGPRGASGRRMALSAVAAPTDYVAGGRPSLLSLAPTASSLAAVVSALHEYLGIAYYRVAYGV